MVVGLHEGSRNLEQIGMINLVRVDYPKSNNSVHMSSKYDMIWFAEWERRIKTVD